MSESLIVALIGAAAALLAAALGGSLGYWFSRTTTRLETRKLQLEVERLQRQAGTDQEQLQAELEEAKLTIAKLKAEIAALEQEELAWRQERFNRTIPPAHRRILKRLGLDPTKPLSELGREAREMLRRSDKLDTIEQRAARQALRSLAKHAPKK